MEDRVLLTFVIKPNTSTEIVMFMTDSSDFGGFAVDCEPYCFDLGGFAIDCDIIILL